jgi:DNA polymerase zeta
VTSNIYSFENMAYHILHQRLPHFKHATLTHMYTAPEQPIAARWLVARYYANRTAANLLMLDKLNIVGRTSELARLYGIDFVSVLTRGSQYRVESMMLRLTKPNNYILLSPSRAQVNHMRAAECLPLIMEPISRFYTSPVVVLDFQSLYPSIIIAHNYCYSTCLGRMETTVAPSTTAPSTTAPSTTAPSTTASPPSNVEIPDTKHFGAASISLPKGLIAFLEQEDQLTVSPNQVMFVKRGIRKGVLPAMLQQILDTRIMVKSAMKRARKQHKHALARMLDARQFGLKMIANVTYGYTSASFSGRMPCIDVADSIVQTARETLERAIRLVESNSQWRARVVYGDTDSLFVLLDGASRERAFEVGQQIADAVTRANPPPVVLKFEKVYHPCTLLSKKRYAGAMYESCHQAHAVFDAKGIETVRRDTCGAVAKIMRKSMSMLFDNADLSRIKRYLQRQFIKIASGRVSVQDFIFAKEVRLGSYSDKTARPPAALVACKQMELDPRAEPRYGERVPYVVVYGAPNARLIDLVMCPDDFVTSRAPDLRLHATYYTTKQLIPALERVFQLLGADVRQWYSETPRSSAAAALAISRYTKFRQQHAQPKRNKFATIYQYYTSCHCPVCNAVSNRAGLCAQCRQTPQSAVLKLTLDVRAIEKQHTSMVQLCLACCTVPQAHLATMCDSLDCMVYFERQKLAQALLDAEGLRHVIVQDLS